MELIYVWIENYRNIEKCGFKLSNNFSVKVDHNSCEQIDNFQVSIKTISIERGPEAPKIYENNIRNVNALVGKNSTGKSNFLTCIGDLLTSFHDSSFIFIYFDKSKNKYILECNQIGITSSDNIVKYAIRRSYQPKTTLYQYDSGLISLYNTEESLIHDIEFINIGKTLNSMTFPNSNWFYSDIGRFGLSYDKFGVLYQFKYLRDYINNNETFKNNSIMVKFEINGFFDRTDKYLLRILPEFFPEKKCLLDFYGNKGVTVYKKVFMLRFFEKVLNNMRFLDHDIVKKERNELLKIINDCSEDIDKLLSVYDQIKIKAIQIRSILMANNMENDINLDFCYIKFVEQLEKVISKIDEHNFENSFKCSILVSRILDQEDFMDTIEKLLVLADDHDVCLEYIPQNIKISFDNLSSGLGYLMCLYSTIHKCLKQNEVERFNNVILILDEPETHMHPEWSRTLLFNIFDFLREQFSETKFQIILSTHSPFILSDIPKGNVILLEKDENGLALLKNNNLTTFGANIHSLLKDSFFVESTLGEFARSRINEVLRFLINRKYIGNMTKEKAKHIINSIGEDLIRSKLQKLYEEKFPEDVRDLSKRIELFQNKISDLQKNVDYGNTVDKTKLLALQQNLKTILDGVTDLLNNGDAK